MYSWWFDFPAHKLDALAKALEMANQKFRSTRRSGFSGVKAYRLYVKDLKNHCNAVGRTFYDAIKLHQFPTKPVSILKLDEILVGVPPGTDTHLVSFPVSIIIGITLNGIEGVRIELGDKSRMGEVSS
jgi:hypothetical protein